MTIRPVFGAVSIIVAAVLASTPAGAAKPPGARHFSVSAFQTVVSSTGTPPNAGATAVEKGPVTGSLGTGTITFRGKWSALRRFTGTLQIKLAHGTLRGTLHGSGTLRGDGTTAVTGAGRIGGGSRSYAHATGRFTFTATVPAGGGPLRARYSGTLRP